MIPSKLITGAIVLLLVVLLVSALAGSVYWATEQQKKTIMLDELEAQAVMLKHADIVPDEHGNPTFRWREVGYEQSNP